MLTPPFFFSLPVSALTWDAENPNLLVPPNAIERSLTLERAFAASIERVLPSLLLGTVESQEAIAAREAQLEQLFTKMQRASELWTPPSNLCLYLSVFL